MPGHPVRAYLDKGNSGHVSAPFGGVVTLEVAVGDHVEAGAKVASIEAMKMEAAITAASAGIVERLAISLVQQVEGGDLLLAINAPPTVPAQV